MGEIYNVVEAIARFEEAFSFHFHDSALKDFLACHSGEAVRSGHIKASGEDMELSSILSFTAQEGANSAWAVNKWVRRDIGKKRIAIASGTYGDYLCVEREWQNQHLVIYNCQNGQIRSASISIADFCNPEFFP